MKLVRDRLDTSWAPARFNHSLFRLMAVVVASRLRVRNERGHVRVIDRHQNPIESYTIAAWQIVTISSYAAAFLVPQIGWPAAVFLSIVIAALAVHVIVVALGIVTGLFVSNRERDRSGIVTALTMLLLVCLAVRAVTLNNWARYVAALFLFFLLLNALSAAVLWLMREQVAAVNRERGVPE